MMSELKLLAPTAATLLLIPRGERPKAESDYFRQRVPFRLQGSIVRRAYRSLPGDPLHRVPYLILRPKALREGEPPGPAGRRRLFLHPLLFALLLRRNDRPVQVDWGAHREPLSVATLAPARGPSHSPPRILRPTALLAIARRRQLRLILLVLCNLRLLPVLLHVEHESRRRSSQLLPVIALLSALVLLVTAPLAREPNYQAPGNPEPWAAHSEMPPAAATSPALSPLTGLLSLLADAPGEVAIEAIEGTPAALHVSLRASKVDRVRSLLQDSYPSALLETESSDWLLAEAGGRILLTIQLP